MSPDKSKRNHRSASPKICGSFLLFVLIVMAAVLSPASAATASSDNSAVNNLIHDLRNAPQIRAFEATYFVAADQLNGTYVVAKKGDRYYQRIPATVATDTGGPEITIYNGKRQYACGTVGETHMVCVTTKRPSTPPQTIARLGTVKGVISDVRSWVADFHTGVSFVSKRIAGQASMCLLAGRRGSDGVLCVDPNKELVTYENDSSSDTTLKSFNSHVPSSLFHLPAKATVQTVPDSPTSSPRTTRVNRHRRT